MMKTLTKTLTALALAAVVVSVRARAKDRPRPAPLTEPPSMVKLRVTSDDGQTIATFEVDRDLID